MKFSSVQRFGFVQEGSGTSGEMDAKYMEDPCSVCIMSQALGNAYKGSLVQPKELGTCELSQCFGRGRALEQGRAFCSRCI